MLPHDLARARDAALHGVSSVALARAAATISQRYRDAAPARSPALRSEQDALAYLAYRLPATYAATLAALRAAAARLPGWPPRTVLDLGSGPGTAMWAVAALWPQVERFVLVERDPRMLALGRRLAAAADVPAIRRAEWRQLDMTRPLELPACDLVIAAYTLGELPPARLPRLVSDLWRACDGLALIVEPGTPRGFATVQSVRALLIEAGGHTVAPCPHDAPCPLGDGDWCHFVERLARDHRQRVVKRAALGHEDEPYSYAAVARRTGLPIAGRVIGRPRRHSSGIDLDLCTPAGLRSETIGRRDERYAAARHLRRGDALVDDS